MVSARRFRELGAGTGEELDVLAGVQVTPRELNDGR
jgi:hypothetical protein